MQSGEVLRRVAFNMLDRLKGGKLNQIKQVNEYEIVNGITQEYADRRISALLSYAKENCPFYRKNYGTAETLQEFPVMTKGDFLARYDDVLSDLYRDGKQKTYKLSTSGSTGTPFTVLCNQDKMNRVNMNFISVMELNGFRLGMKRGEFRAWIKGKNTISRMTSIKNNLIMVEISNMGDEALEGICRQIEKQRIQVLVAYSSAMTALTSYLQRTGRDISRWAVEMIFTMGEGLPDTTYDAIEEVFDFSPVRSYGNNENGFIAVSLPWKRQVYTIDLYNFHVEILKMHSDEPAAPGELGRIVVTDFYNRAFPLIRYDTGDTGIMETEIDEEGRKHAYFTTIYGRKASMLYSTSGEPLSMHVFMNILFCFQDVLSQGKCIQWEKDRYELVINAEPGQVDEDNMRREYRKYLGSDARIDITYVDEIPVQQSGKRMVCEQKCSEYM